MIHKLIYKVGVRLRSPELFTKYKFLRESEKWSLEELEAYQFIRLKRIIGIAYNKSLFYRSLFDDTGVKIEDIKSLSDIKIIPTIKKVDLLNNREAIQNKEGYRKLFFSETSGSTGEPLVFYRNSEWDDGHRAAILRGYSWHGINPWDFNGYLWGYSFSAKSILETKVLDVLQNRFRLFTYDKETIKKFAKKLKGATYLEGYSSMVYEVAKLINENSLGSFNLKLVKGTSETISDSYQAEAKSAFGQKIVSEYGSSEIGIIAHECKEGHMHITMENVIVEEEDGEIIVTNLNSDSFPIIRYRLGDRVVLGNEVECPCGMQHKTISEVIGRVGKSIYGNKNKYTDSVLIYIFKTLAKHGTIINYQAIQKEKGRIELYLDREMSGETEKILRGECEKYFSDDIDVVIYANKLKRDYNKKFIDFISEIDG